METVAFGGIIFLILVLIGQGNDFNKVLPIVTLYAFAGYRLLPALQKIFSALTKIKYNIPIVELLQNDFLNLQDPVPQKEVFSGKRINLTNKIEVNNISFSYPGADTAIISSQSLIIEANTTVALVGPTGCGKTTMVDLIMGLLYVNGGEIIVDGSEITKDNIREWQNNIGYIPQNIFLLDSSIKKNIAFGIPDDQIDINSVRRAAAIANLDSFIEKELESGYEQIVGERGVRLSGGQRQRIGIARAVYHNPSVLIMDEATSALDNITELAIMEAINNLSHEKTIIMIAHRLSTVQKCDRIFLMNGGVIEDQGSYDELLSGNKHFQKMARGMK